MNYYEIMYWVTRADSIREFFDTSSNIFTTCTVISFIGLFILTIWRSMAIESNRTKNEEEDKVNPEIRSIAIPRKYVAIIFWICLGLSILTWFVYMAIPTKKDALLIMGGGATLNFITTDSSARKLPSELTTFVVNELKSAAKEAKIEYSTNDIKDKILQEAKNMSPAELIEKMKVDSNFAKVLMDK